MDLLPYLQRLFAYDDWANREVLDSPARTGGRPARSLKLLSHIVAAEVLWLARLRREKSPMAVWPELSLDECRVEIDRLAGRWSGYLGALPAAGLDQTIAYTNSKGEPWTSRVEDVLTHVATHSAYHRGQIAADLRSHGHEPAYTDFIHAVRQRKLP